MVKAHSTPAVRAFVAIELGARARELLGGMARGLAERLPELRMVPVERLHVTLAFLGDIAEESVAVVAGALAQAVHRVAPFQMTVGGLGAFPDPQRPRVVFSPIGGELRVIASLAERVRHATRAIGIQADEDKPFRPHVTLARCRGRRLPGLAEELDRPSLAVARSPVRMVTLMESRLAGSSPSYVPRARLPLGGRCERPPSAVGAGGVD